MAMSSAILKTAIITELTSQGFDVPNAPYLSKLADAIATAVVNHIVTTAVVNTTVTGVTGVGAPGGPLPITAQPGVGAIT